MRKREPLGHWLDESFPHCGATEKQREGACKLLTDAGIDEKAFTLWLKPHLGQYRSEMHVRENLVPRAEKLSALRRARTLLDETAGALLDVPQDARTMIATLGVRNSVDRADLHELAQDLRIASVLVNKVADGIEGAKIRRGRKPDIYKNRLLADCVKEMVERYSLKAHRARELTAELLVLCHVEHVPEHPDRLKRANVKGRKKPR